MATLVLVHGAFTGGWIWAETAARLTRLGHAVHTPTLTGCGERSHLLHMEVCFSTHVQDVSQLLFYQDLEGAILVGHDYGGMVAATVAHRLMAKAAGVVYIDGVIPKRGFSYAAIAGNRLIPKLASHDKNVWFVPPFSAGGFGISDERLEDWFSKRLQPFPQLAFTQPNPYGAKVQGLPSVYVRCEGNGDPLAKAMAAQAGLLGMTRISLETGPYPMLTAPDRLAEQIDRLAGELTGAAARPAAKTAGARVPRSRLNASRAAASSEKA
jgi:pimeloyl-ACP methyl ester carboxylesterase